MSQVFGARAVFGVWLLTTVLALSWGCSHESPGESPLTLSPAETGALVGKDVAPVCDAGGPHEVDLGETLKLDGSESFARDGKILSWRWDLGDRRILEGPSVFVSFDIPGKHVVTLCVTDSKGLESCCKTVVAVRKQAGLECDAGGNYSTLNGEPFVLDGSGSSGPIEEWHWDLGDGRTVEGERVAVTYRKPGLYEVGLCVMGPDANRICCTTLVKVIGDKPDKPDRLD